MISIFVSKALAVVTDNETLTSGMAGAEIKFSFSEDWDNLTKTAIFRAGDVANAVIGSQWTDNVCTIPHETLATAGEELRVGVYGVNSDKKVIIPTIWATVGVVRVGVDPSADESTDATLPVWAQVQETAEGAEKTAEEAKETADHAESIAKVFLITYNDSAVDKTYAEIVEAVNAGNTIHISFPDGGVYEPQVKITENGPVKLEWMRIMSEEHYWVAVTIATDGTATDTSAHIADGADLAKYRTTDDSYSKSETDTLLASAGKVKTVNGVEPDANGNITISTAGGTQITDDGSGNITITCMAADVTATDDGSGNITLGGA